MPITLTGLPPKETVESWIIALSAIGGLFILLIFSSVLVKAGFFERKKKDQLKMLKQEVKNFFFHFFSLCEFKNIFFF